MQRSVTLLLTVALLIQLILPGAAFAQTTETTARITANSLNVRSGPGTTFDIVDKVTLGMELLTIREEAGWVQVELPSGATGWVSSKYAKLTEVTVTTAEPTETTPPPASTPEPVVPTTRTSSAGGVSFGSVFKWSCLLGAGALGALAYQEKSQGDDSYDEYKAFALNDDTANANVKWDETQDHDDKAQLFGIVAGSLAGIFVLQQFVFGGGGDSSYSVADSKPLPLSYNPLTQEYRASITLARF